MSTARMVQGQVLAELAGNEYDARYRLSLSEREGLLILALEGRLMREVPEDFAQTVQKTIDGHHRQEVLLDLESCEYILSSALGFLVRLLRTTRASRKQVPVLGSSHRIRCLFEILNLEEHVRIVDSEETALAWFERQRQEHPALSRRHSAKAPSA